MELEDHTEEVFHEHRHRIERMILYLRMLFVSNKSKSAGLRRTRFFHIEQ